eukprot:1356816-Pyramimonas_sp.AAC.1
MGLSINFASATGILSCWPGEAPERRAGANGQIPQRGSGSCVSLCDVGLAPKGTCKAARSLVLLGARPACGLLRGHRLAEHCAPM